MTVNLPAGHLERSAPTSGRRRMSFTSHTGAILALVAPFLILLTLFYLVPIGYALVQSFFKLERSSAFGSPREVFAGFEQYVHVLENAAFWGSLGRVGVLLVTMVPVMILLGLLFALLIDSTLVKGRRFFRLAFFAPYAVPGVIAAIMWGFFYAPTLSPLPGVAESLNLLDSRGIMIALANIIVWTVSGFNMLIMYSALQAVPQELYEAARMDGAGNVRIAVLVKVPLIMPSIIMTGVLSIIGTLQLFNEPTVLKTLSKAVGLDFTPNMLVFNTASIPNYNLAAATSVVLALLTAALSFVFLRITQKRAFE
ncbi:carbohydrate ABC transporter permease [Subtercola frigoramans]|uniref:Multiple sugar transport system permease protein n=1 Tax=Subtercola frigoramans TaxID=120298 RepID=A0ABS2L1N4_9MICO|nr:sugar ABC transporter permease [Subtercola frigoramans]MBM7470996.1 multiple sugar transport system permease protein [Subtercola frigoramans]